jgi:hypothetical protein
MATDRTNIRQLSSRRRLVSGLALALIVTALAIPGAAAAIPVGPPVGGGARANPAPAAVPFAADQNGTGTAANSAGTFDWGDAMIGAGGALALVALISAGGFTLRAHQRMTPATPSQG